MSENIFYYIKEVKNNKDSNKIIDLNELKNEINYNSIQ